MSNLSERIAALSPEEQALFIKLLNRKSQVASLGRVIPQRDKSGPLPLSFAQERLWFLDQLEPNSSFYNISMALRIKGSLNLRALELAFAEILRRHESLRTTFSSEAGQPIQIVHPASFLQLPVTDLCHLPKEMRQQEARRLYREEASVPFDLTEGPLIRILLLRMEEAIDWVMLLTMHHIVSDGWSTGLLLQEIAILYGAFSENSASPLPELPVQYADFACWQRQWLSGEILERQLAFWKQHLRGALPVLELPFDRPRPAIQTFNGATLTHVLDKDLSSALETFSSRREVTMFMTLLAAFQTLLYRYTGQEEIILGLPVAGRDRKEVRQLIGLFVNTLVMRADLGGNPVFRDLLGRVREMALDAFGNQDLPFEKLVEALQPVRDMSRTPLFQVSFVLQKAPVENPNVAGLAFSPMDRETSTAKFDLILLMLETPEGLRTGWEYNTDLFDAGTIERMAGHFETLLKGIVTNPETRLSLLPLITDSEKHQLLFEWSSGTTAYNPHSCLHQLFEIHAIRTPDAIAVTYEEKALTYGQLNARADRLALYLQANGVGPEVVVGVCLRRSIEMVVAVIAVLKAGGAYLPLDAEQPLERLSYMLEDAGVGVVLTEQALEQRLPVFWGQTICLDQEWEAIDRECENELKNEVGAENLAYIIYTSGSTGKPKGVMINHGGLVNYLTWATGNYRIGEGQGAPVSSSLGFDLTVTSLYGPLVSGKKVDLLSEEQGIEALEAALIRERGYSLVKITPAHLSLLDRQLKDAEIEGRAKALVIGGEELTHKGLRAWQQRAEETRLINEYGPTETVVGCSVYEVKKAESVRESVPIGRPIANTQMYVLDREFEPAPVGITGEIYISGAGLARGYAKRPELTAEKFIPNRFGRKGGERLYRTGDLGRYLSDGNIDFVGRTDDQVKVRGYRIELGEIEAALREHPAVIEAVTAVREGREGEKRLVAYLVNRSEMVSDHAELRGFLKERLPEYMVPSAFVVLERLPLSPNGKIDRKNLPDPNKVDSVIHPSYVAPQTELEQTIAAVWQELLQIDQVGIHDNFFDLGAHSLMMVQASSKLQDLLETELPVLKLFQYPNISALAAHLSQGKSNGMVFPQREPLSQTGDPAGNNDHRATRLNRPIDIAIIGMSGRFPQAPTIDIFWRNLCEAREAFSPLSDSELLAAGVDPQLLDDPRYVKVAASLDGIDRFDASFFGFSPREAEILDPQHRLFLQSAWHALESAGYVPDRFPGQIGVFAGAGLSHYFLSVLLPNPDLMATVGAFQTGIANDKDYLPTRVSYKLNLRGPSVAVQTACSTSLVAVHMACQSLLNGECDMALAGGVSIAVPQATGYLYQEGGIASSDGHCRAFDAQASGTIGGSGLGVVVLKRLAAARADGDHILAVIKGSAVNNDGSNKVGYTAPSIDGQARAIAKAQAMAGVDPETVTYVEAHGTATALGDPIEIAALTRVFRAATRKRGYCAVGSVKTNLGHLDSAAGVTGLIKTVLALKHRQIPASLHFERPNPQIDFSDSPFYVNTELREWETDGALRRAGVSSFGIGGTNAHLVLEEAPPVEPSERVAERVYGWHLLVLSARSDRALTIMAEQLAAYLRQRPEIDLADVAYTLQEGRKAFAHRLIVVCRDVEEAIMMLEGEGSGRHAYRAVAGERAMQVVYMFPGQGAQYVGMGRELYEQEPEYRSVIDRCAEIVEKQCGIDLRRVLYPGSEEEEQQAAGLINETRVTQVALFAVELGLARMWQSKGVQPAAMIGHSLGEYVAGCVAGVMSEEEAVKLVAKRAELMNGARRGAMMAMALSEGELREKLSKMGSRVEVAAINGPQQCVVSGEEEEIAGLEQWMNKEGIAGKRLKTSHAFHSRMMEEVVGEFKRVVERVEMRQATIRYISNVSGNWISGGEEQTAGYWGRQMRSPVRFWEGLEQIGREIKDRVLLEVGPGVGLSRLGGKLNGGGRQGIVATLEGEADSGARTLLEAVGKLWAGGVEIEWEKWRKGKRRRVELPGYAFEEERYWVDGAGGTAGTGVVKRKTAMEDWFYTPVWKQAAVVNERRNESEARTWLILEDEGGIGQRIARELQQQGCVVTRVRSAERYERRGESEYDIRVGNEGDYQRVLKELDENGQWPEKIVHLLGLRSVEDGNARAWEQRIREAEDAGFYSLVYLARAIGQKAGANEIEIVAVSNGVADVLGEEEIRAENAVAIGPIKVMGQEYPQLKSRYIDVVIPSPGSRQEERLIGQLLADFKGRSANRMTAYRGNRRWVQTYEAAQLDPVAAGTGLRQGGVYLITGGLGKVGMMVAEYLAESVKARLVLTSREGLQPETDERIKRKIAKIVELEESGAEVEVIRADVSQEAEMMDAVRRAEQRFGPINGVIHAAGVTGEESINPIQEITPAGCEALFRPKIQGLFVLDKIFQDAKLDFCILFSSLSSILGGLGFAAYSSANIFMDAFIHGRNRISPAPWISVNWDSWQLSHVKNHAVTWFGSAQAVHAIKPEEGIEAFQRIISMKMGSQIIVSTGELESRISQWVDLESLRPISRSGHSRPELQSVYAAPRNDLEQSIADIWQDLLGVEQIGIHDNFFELGGHSLLVIECMSRLRQRFQVEIPIRSIFEKSTIAEYGEIVEEALIGEIEALTEEDAVSLHSQYYSS